jgi:hypothetical protein
MADWTTPLPADAKVGDDGHPDLHNQIKANVVEIRNLVDSGALNGKDGAAGAKGATGAAGAKGDKGDTGATGAKGADGKDLSAELAALTARVAALETPAG